MDGESSLRDTAAILAACQKAVNNLGQDPYVVLPEGFRIESIAHLMPHPSRISASFITDDIDGFSGYVRRFHSPSSTVAFVKEGLVEVIFDFHSKDQPKWCHHTAVFKGDLKSVAAALSDIPVFRGDYMDDFLRD